MKYIPAVITTLLIWSCNKPGPGPNHLATQRRIDSLEANLAGTYKPGLGEFMGSIQVHHAKLWFAGQNQNWELADFEIHEIKEAMDDIQRYCSDRPEVKELGMIKPSMDNMTNAIRQKDQGSFKRDFLNLTNTCNSCHQGTDYGFIVIKVPDNPPFGNQEFKLNPPH